MSVTFTTTVLQAPGKQATGLPVPPDSLAELTSAKNPLVTVTIGSYTYASRVGTMFGGPIIPLSSAHRSALGIGAGDSVEVVLELDLAPRTVAVPADLGAALDAASGSREAFESLSPSRKGAIVTAVEAAKTDETRARRIESAIQQLLG